MLGEIFALPPFSGAGSVFHQSPLLSMCYDGLLFVFQFCRAVWFWVLLTSSRDDFCDLIHYLTCFGEWLIACLLLAFLPFLCLFTDSSALRLAPCPSSFLWCTFSVSTPLLLC
jgi:hypothetical protein